MSCQPLISFDLPDPPQIWLVVFLDPADTPGSSPFANRLLTISLKIFRPGFRHVLAMSPVASGGWIICNPGSCSLGVGVYKGEGPFRMVQEGVRGGRTHCLATIGQHPVAARLRLIFTCVNAIAHLTGIDCPFWTTPWQLFRRMRAMHR